MPASTAAPAEQAAFPCRLCGGTACRLFYTQGNAGEFRFYRCPACGLVNYDLAGGLDQAKYAREYIDPLDERIRSNLAQTITARLLARRLPARGRLLEIGCGNGRLLHLAREAGWQVEGLELSPFLAESVRARLGIAVTVADFLSWDPAAGARYDAVLLRHVLEHLPDAVGAMRRLRGLLADGGHALLEFPNIDAADLRLKRWLRRAGLHRRAYPPGYRPGHCNEYGRATFERLLARTGFSLVHWETYSYRPLANALYNRWPIGNKARALIRAAAAEAAA